MYEPVYFTKTAQGKQPIALLKTLPVMRTEDHKARMLTTLLRLLGTAIEFTINLLDLVSRGI